MQKVTGVLPLLSHTRVINLVPSEGESSPKENDRELVGQNWPSSERCVSSVHTDRLISVCHSNFVDTLIGRVVLTTDNSSSGHEFFMLVS